MMNIDEVILRAEEEEVGIAESDWFEEPDYEQLEAAYERYEREFERLLPQFVARLGQPDFTEASEPELRDELYCEARRIAGWKRGDGYLLLAFGQHDKETPVFVSLGFRTR